MSFCHSELCFVWPAHPVTRHQSFWRAVIYGGSDHCGICASWQCRCCFCFFLKSCRWHQIMDQIVFFALPRRKAGWTHEAGDSTSTSQRSLFPNHIAVSSWQSQFLMQRRNQSKDFLPKSLQGVCYCLVQFLKSLSIRLSFWISQEKQETLTPEYPNQKTPFIMPWLCFGKTMSAI